jgi:excisionase family DNA binding protein
MNCDDALERLSAFLDDDLPDIERNEVQAHLDNCPLCRAECTILDQITADAKALPLSVPGSELILKISAAIHATETPPPPTEFGPVLTLDELCAYLRVERATVVQYLPEIPCFELGGKLLFRRKSIEQWVEQREQSVTFQVTALPMDSAVLPQDVVPGGVRWTL